MCRTVTLKGLSLGLAAAVMPFTVACGDEPISGGQVYEDPSIISDILEQALDESREGPTAVNCQTNPEAESAARGDSREIDSRSACGSKFIQRTQQLSNDLIIED